ncbi:ceramidase [Aspergillus alliaceus]|uniref:ceramidase n=1 Tax=Petromyces alliaceus TaxID=209559 RepID=UPI0012A61ABF|nr:ceramidase [Aspergillus alliaceus]KAB8235675.1 ceramidase [Aspergillus alliaceus]
MSIQYPAQRSGFWTPATSTLNWCEEDYYATIYAAEIVNSMTNLLFVWLGTKGIINCRRNGHDPIFVVAYTGYLLVGIGSFLFHATLKYPMQLVDELSMIYTVCVICYSSFSHQRSAVFRLFLAILLFCIAVSVTLYYHFLGDPTFHQRVFAILSLAAIFHGIYSMHMALHPLFRYPTKEGRPASGKRDMPISTNEGLDYQSARDLAILRSMWHLGLYGLGLFFTGYIIWNLDNQMCNDLRKWRRIIGLPWGIILEGHGWWHLMSGTGAYVCLVWEILLRHCANGQQENYSLWWPYLWSVPEVRRVKQKK